jgi:hypothetical protein
MAGRKNGRVAYHTTTTSASTSAAMAPAVWLTTRSAWAHPGARRGGRLYWSRPHPAPVAAPLGRHGLGLAGARMRRILAAVLVVGCGGGDGNDGWNGSIETLPNGAVLVINPAEGVWETGTPWRLVPELVIGALDGHEPEVFGAISGVEADDAGRIFVLDRQANELRIFSPDGSHIRSVGRSGSGPGEYANANGLRWMAPDSLVVVDQRGNRYSILTREGEFVRSVPRTLGFFGWAFEGGVEDGTIYERFVVGGDGDPKPALFGTSLRPPALEQPGATTQEPRDVPRHDPAVDTVYLPVPDGALWEGFSVRNERGGMQIAVPFAPGPVYHLDGNGSVWHGHGNEFRISRSSLAGDTIMEIVLNVEPVPVTTEELGEWQAQPSVTQFQDLGGRVDFSRIPTTKPFFNDVHLDPEGYLWAAMPAGPRVMAFAVIDPDGRYLGRVVAAGLVRDTFVPPVVRNGRLYVSGRDALDVPGVYVFRIER